MFTKNLTIVLFGCLLAHSTIDACRRENHRCAAGSCCSGLVCNKLYGFEEPQCKPQGWCETHQGVDNNAVTGSCRMDHKGTCAGRDHACNNNCCPGLMCILLNGALSCQLPASRTLRGAQKTEESTSTTFQGDSKKPLGTADEVADVVTGSAPTSHTMLQDPNQQQAFDFAKQSYTAPGERLTELHGFKLDTELSDIDTAIYHNPSTNRVHISHRGSVTAEDWAVSDVSIALSAESFAPRFKKAKRLTEAAAALFLAARFFCSGLKLPPW